MLLASTARPNLNRAASPGRGRPAAPRSRRPCGWLVWAPSRVQASPAATLARRRARAGPGPDRAPPRARRRTHRPHPWCRPARPAASRSASRRQAPSAIAPAAPSVTTQVRSWRVARPRGERLRSSAARPMARGHRRLDLVDHQDVERVEHGSGHRRRRREIEDRARAAPRRPLEQREGRLRIDLVLAEQGHARPQIGIGDLVGAGREIGAAADDDLVLAAGLDPDHRDAGRSVLRSRRPRSRRRPGPAPGAGTSPKLSSPRWPTMRTAAPALAAAAAWLAPLPPGCERVARTQHGLARPRQGLRPGTPGRR